MTEPIYFSKIQFKDRVGYGKPRSVILLDIVQKELSYQVYEWKKQMPAISGMETYEINGNLYDIDLKQSAKVIKTGSNNFKKELLPDEYYIGKIVFSYCLKLSASQMQQLLPYCNALDSEPYRNRKMSMSDEGYIGYRDEISLLFTGVTNSYIPKMEWEMRYYYDEENIWPSEKLYRYIVQKYLGKVKS